MRFRAHIKDLWRRTLRRRSQKDQTSWERITKLADDFLPQPLILHPGPVSDLAKRFSCTATEVSAVLDRFADLMIDDKTRKHTLASELARLDHETPWTVSSGLGTKKAPRSKIS